MLLFSLLTAAIAPGLLLLAYFYLKDHYDAEPMHMVIRMFLVGVFVSFPILFIQSGLIKGLGESPFLFAFVISAGVEESLKWFVLFHMIYNHLEFDEPYDGILYATAISLGFATFENVLYALFQPTSLGTLFVRALLPVSGHALFGVFMGYYMARAKFHPAGRPRKMLAFSLLLPLFWHGLYDWIMLTVQTQWIWFIVPLMGMLWIRGMRKVQRANARSPFRVLHVEEESVRTRLK